MSKRILFLIVLLAVFLRFYQLGKNPPHLNWDEAAIGYNAFSLLQTGRDEYGKSFPFSFRSFDDYKPPLYVYLTIPSVAVFGLNDWAVRFPSAFFGVLTVVMMYFLVKEIFVGAAKERSGISPIRKRRSGIEIFRRSRIERVPDRSFRIVPLTAAFLLAISPWHIQFSRVAFEANLALFFVVLGSWAFLKGIKKPIFLLFSATALSLSLYSYHSPRVFVPLLGIVLVLIFRKKLLENWRYCLFAVILGIIICLPLVKIMTSVEGQMRVIGTSAFRDSTALLQESIDRIMIDQEQGFPLARFFHNRRFVYLQIAFKTYLSHFNLNWLFLENNFGRHHAPGVSLLYFWELPLIILGSYWLLKNKQGYYQIVFFWLLLAPVPAIPTIDIPHAIRVFNMVIPFHILSAYGIVQSWQLIKNKLAGFKFLVVVFSFTFLVFSFVYYFHQYYVHMPIEYSYDWQYGRKEMVLEAEKLKDSYNEIIISPELEKSYIFFLYYLQYDPQQYLAEGGTVSGGYDETKNKVGKYQFKPLEQEAKRDGKTLYIGTAKEFPENVSSLKTIYYLNNEEAIKFVNR